MSKEISEKYAYLVIERSSFLSVLYAIVKRYASNNINKIAILLTMNQIFPRGFPVLLDHSEAVLTVCKSEKLRDLKNLFVSSYNSSASETIEDEDRLGLSSF